MSTIIVNKRWLCIAYRYRQTSHGEQNMH